MKKTNMITTIIISTFLTVITCVPTMFVSAEGYVCGDTTNDGVVDISDAVIIERFIRKDIPYMPWNREVRDSGEPIPWEYTDFVCGDVNMDGEVTVADSVIVQRYVARTIGTLPYIKDITIEPVENDITEEVEDMCEPVEVESE